MDINNLFSDEQDLASVTTSGVLSDKSIPVTSGMNQGAGSKKINVVANLDTDLTSSVSCAVRLVTAADAALTSGLVEVATIGTFASGAKAGAVVAGPLPSYGAYKAYIGLKYVPSGTVTAGKVSGGLRLEVPGEMATYPVAANAIV